MTALGRLATRSEFPFLGFEASLQAKKSGYSEFELGLLAKAFNESFSKSFYYNAPRAKNRVFARLATKQNFLALVALQNNDSAGPFSDAISFSRPSASLQAEKRLLGTPTRALRKSFW